MRRQYGRHLNPYYYIEVELLPDDEYFSPSEIVKRKLDKKTDPESFNKMFHCIYQFGARNGLALFPDNCVRDSSGKPVVLENGKTKLLPGERSAKWTGKTWKSKLYVDDREQILNYAQIQLVTALQQCLSKKQQIQKFEKESAMEEKRSFRLKRRLWVAVLVAAIVLTAGGLYTHNYLGEGISVLRSDGPRAAYEFFQNRGESYENLFGKAWAAYRIGDYEIAEETAQRVLKSRDSNYQAKAWYLLGDMKTIAGEYEKAKELLLNAHAIYESIGKEDSLYRTRLMLVKLFLAKRDFYHSDYYIALAESFEGSRSDHYFLYLKSQEAFLNNDFETALKFSLQREDVLKGDRARLTKIFSDSGFYYGLLGDLQKLVLYTNKSNEIAEEQEDEKSLIYNRINICLYLKCSMQDYDEDRSKIIAYARRNNDVRLMEHMYFVDKFVCPLAHTDSGDAPPPGRTDTGDPSPPGEASVEYGKTPPPDEEN